MTRTTQLLEALANVLAVLEKTVEMLEAESPSLAEVGYWTDRELWAYQNAHWIVNGKWPGGEGLTGPPRMRGT